ncbi:unannotated protein [freshwater metagenome]|uniref:Unannotated protein n=1 Tax=freshwater metagenome TaxID=449393 RepID=A0A6J7SEW7_9ZZZZ
MNLTGYHGCVGMDFEVTVAGEGDWLLRRLDDDAHSGQAWKFNLP